MGASVALGTDAIWTFERFENDPYSECPRIRVEVTTKLELRINFNETSFEQRSACFSFLYTLFMLPSEEYREGKLDQNFLLVLSTALLTLDALEDRVLRLRYGLLDGKRYSIDETAELLNRSGAEIVHLENLALANLRRPLRLRQLKTLLLRDASKI